MSQIIIIIITILFFAGIIIFLYKNNENLLYKLAYEAVIKAEDTYGSGKGQEKKEIAIKNVKEKIPKYIQWVINTEAIDFVVQKSFDFLKKYLNNKAVEKQIVLVDTVLGKIDSKNINEMKVDLIRMKTDIKNTGYVEGFVESDLKNNTKVGIKAGVKF